MEGYVMDLGISALIARALQFKKTNKETPPNFWLLAVRGREEVAENKRQLDKKYLGLVMVL